MNERITERDFLLRRVVFPHPHLIKPNGELSSLAFKPRKGVDDDGVSVDIEKLTTHEQAVVDTRKYRLYRLSASVPFELGLECVHAPLPENDAHAPIKGVTTSGARRLARNAQYISI